MLNQKGLFFLPQCFEHFFHFFPRITLQWLEVYAIPFTNEKQSTEELLKFWRDKKIALVKQTAYPALFTINQPKIWMEAVFSCPYHLGPFSFLADLGADYFIVRQASEPETFAWQDKYSYDPDPRSSVAQKLEEIRNFESSPIGSNLPSVDDIRWESYDLVVSIDIPIPERIVKKTPRTLWSYFSIEAGGPLQKNSLVRPLAGYQLFLNHGFRRYRSRPWNKKHVLEFPLQFQSQRAWGQILSSLSSENQRSLLLVDRNSWNDPPPQSKLPISQPSGSAHEYLRLMGSAFACLHTTSRPRWGNWAVEAVLAGAVFIGNAQSLAQVAAILAVTDCRKLSDAVTLAHRLHEQPAVASEIQRLQASIVDYVAFSRPLNDLTVKARQFFHE